MPTSKKRKAAVDKAKAARRPQQNKVPTVTFELGPIPHWSGPPWDVYLAETDKEKASELAAASFKVVDWGQLRSGSLDDEAITVGKTAQEAAESMAGFAAKGLLTWVDQVVTFTVDPDMLEDWLPHEDQAVGTPTWKK